VAPPARERSASIPGTIAVRSGWVETDEHGRPAAVGAVLDPSSIVTGNPRRDRDLVGPHFLNVSQHPAILFTSTSVTLREGEGWTVDGTLAIGERDVPITLDVEVTAASDPSCVTVAARGCLDRVAAGIKAPSFLIGRQVRIDVDAVLSPVQAHLTRADVAR
jgi:polyisoprenoid-binding protein YceI